MNVSAQQSIPASNQMPSRRLDNLNLLHVHQHEVISEIVLWFNGNRTP
jgi:hypothetical protein